MKGIGLFEAKTKLSEICEGVARTRKSVLITRRGRPLVRIEPVDENEQGEGVWQARSAFLAQGGKLPATVELPPRRVDEAREILD